MRRLTATLASIAVLILAAPALGAPTCQDAALQTIKCGAAGAMPVGWRMSAAARWDQEMAHPAGPPAADPLDMILIVGAIFALLALMPPFDGSRDGDWDRQEGD